MFVKKAILQLTNSKRHSQQEFMGITDKTPNSPTPTSSEQHLCWALSSER